jgi:hypothetical protein
MLLNVRVRIAMATLGRAIVAMVQFVLLLLLLLVLAPTRFFE